ncbi:ENTH domain-containing protein [Theileria equi strain WA]|uniref:ENTH domain-containing protein n=1 Tax=Theileria equi strain WA TaxID=1537102 RepID=L0AZW5_THEEQ|nr:ENTH domain-containing protein [Theileria equi strain WA]AFZ80803.1 ENTH domain-containing protein [Theileria equi strain WA]|eukprot:XP_004830469.1 ENTH domain-containing protein [Theileria equi strain WA]
MLRNKLEASNAENQHVRLMNVSELEKCLKEALYTDTVGCPESILYDISQATYHPGFLDRILKAIWKCINSRASKVRRIQKGLSLLQYLVINGSERCISDILVHMDDINALHKLKFSPANREIGALIKEKAVKLTSLICDTEALHAKRKYTASIRDRFVSVGSNNGKMETDVLHKPVYVVDEGKPAPAPEFVRSQIDVPDNRGFLSRLFKGKQKPAVVNVGLYGLPDAQGGRGALSGHSSAYPGLAGLGASYGQGGYMQQQQPQQPGYGHADYRPSDAYSQGGYTHFNDHYGADYRQPDHRNVADYRQGDHGHASEYRQDDYGRTRYVQSQDRRQVHHGGYGNGPTRKSSLDSGSTFKKYSSSSSSSSSSDSASSYDEHIKHGKYVSRGRHKSGNRDRRVEEDSIRDDYGDVFDDSPVFHSAGHPQNDHYVHRPDEGYAGQYGHGHYYGQDHQYSQNQSYPHYPHDHQSHPQYAHDSHQYDHDHHYGRPVGGHYGYGDPGHYGNKYLEPRYASTHQDMPSVHRQYLSRADGSNPFNRG